MYVWVIICMVISAIFKGVALFQLADKKTDSTVRMKKYAKINIGFYVFVGIAIVLLVVQYMSNH